MHAAASRMGSWEVVGVRHSCVFPASSEPDVAIVRAIRGVCPNFVPMNVAMEYASPGGHREVIHYYVLGTWQPYATDDKVLPVQAERPSGFPFTGGVLYAQKPLSEVWKEDSWQRRINCPDIPKPFDWSVLEHVRRVYWELKIPFGKFLMGKVGVGVGDEINERRNKAKEEELARLYEDGKMGMRDDKHQIAREIPRWRDEMASGRDPLVVTGERPTRPSFEIRAPEPPVA